MITRLQKLTTAVTAAAVLATAALAASPGYVDFGKFAPDAGKQYVEVDINASLLRLAAAFARAEEPEVANLLTKLERVRVNVFGLSEDNRADALDRINAFRERLTGEGWDRIVTVREQAGDDVAVYVRQATADAIHGVVVTVVSGDGEAVLVNVVGDVALDQIAKLGESLNLAPLRELKLKPETAGVES